jgi:hypothetical protein
MIFLQFLSFVFIFLGYTADASRFHTWLCKHKGHSTLEKVMYHFLPQSHRENGAVTVFIVAYIDTFDNKKRRYG